MLEKFRIIDTSDIEVSRQAMLQLCGVLAFEPQGDASDFMVATSQLRLSGTTLSYCRYGCAVDLTLPGAAFIRQQIALSGMSQTEMDGRLIDVDVEQGCIVPPGKIIRKRIRSSFQQMNLRIEVPALQKYARAYFGTEPRGLAEFDPITSFRNPAAQYLRRLVLFIANEADAFGTQLPDTISCEMEDALLGAFLLANPNSYAHLFERRTADLTPASVRMAEEYIRANWQRAITVEQLAAVTASPARSLFRSFQRHRGYTPMAFLKAVRLDRARQQLQNPDAKTSVTGTALACGFQNPGHFAKDYSQRFGELPSQTLGRRLRSSR